MKYVLTLCGFLLFGNITFGQALGDIVMNQIESQALGNSMIGEPTTQPMAVYLPPSYTTETTKRYPVIYFLAGYEDTVAAYIKGLVGNFRLKSTLNTVITNGHSKEVIMVLVNSYNLLEGCFFQNSPVTGNWEDFVVNEMVSFMDANYRTIPTAKARALIGLSMGGYGALNLSMRHPSVFSVAIGLCPGLAAPNGMAKTSLFNNTATIRNIISIINKYKNLSRSEAHLQYINSLKNLRSGDWVIPFSLAYGSAFAPDTNVNAPYIKYPYSIDNSNALVIDSSIYKLYEAGFGQLDLKLTTYKDSLLKLQGYAIDYATNDYFAWIVDGSKYYDQQLNEMKIPHQTWTNTGDHGGALNSQFTNIYAPYCDTLLQFDTLHLSNKNDIVTFKVSGLDADAVIDNETKTITLVFKPTANLLNLKPTISVSPGADIQPSANMPVDFSSGEFIYTVTAENGTNRAEWKIISSTTQINDDQSSKTGLLVYPNPADHIFTITMRNDNICSVKLFNILGNPVYQLAGDEHKISIDGKNFEPGMYFLQVKTHNNEFTEKLVLR